MHKKKIYKKIGMSKSLFKATNYKSYSIGSITTNQMVLDQNTFNANLAFFRVDHKHQ